MPTIASSLAADSPVAKLGLAHFLCGKAATAIANLQAAEVSRCEGGPWHPPA